MTYKHRRNDLELMNVTEVAKLLNYKNNTVQRMAQAGRLPATKIGGEWRFDKKDIMALINRGKNAEALNAQRVDKKLA